MVGDESKLAQRVQALEADLARRTNGMCAMLAVTGELAGARTREEAARLTLECGLHSVGAVMGSVWVVDPGGELRLLASSPACEPDVRVAPDAATPIAQAARTGEPVFVGSPEDAHARFPAWCGTIGARGHAPSAWAVLPAVGDRGLVAVACFAYDHERVFTPPDRAFKAVLVRQCALALERIQQQDEERALRRESELLFEVTARANELDDVEAVYRLAIDAVKRGSSSERAAILLFGDDGKMHFKAWDGLSATYRAAVDGHSPWQLDEPNATTIAVDDTEADPAWAAFRPVFRAEGIRALAFVPLLHHRRLIGKFMLYRDAPRPFAARELQLASAVGIQVAAALERRQHRLELARAYEVERRAHLEAEQATRAREEILSVVSHDLRNPLATILMSASGLIAVEGERGHRVRTMGERIHRHAALMTRLIEDLVDFAGIQAGRLALAPSAHAPAEIITTARDLLSPLVDETGVQLDVHVPSALPPVACDSDRVVQVLSNLMSNALKVTPRGGVVEVGAAPDDAAVVFFVKDTGPGIAQAELPRLFERYWRSESATYKGAGLGLSIARGIVDAHGGRIWAESTLGAGSTFFFSLAAG